MVKKIVCIFSLDQVYLFLYNYGENFELKRICKLKHLFAYFSLYCTLENAMQIEFSHQNSSIFLAKNVTISY